jgi:hypothetical protein
MSDQGLKKVRSDDTLENRVGVVWVSMLWNTTHFRRTNRSTWSPCSCWGLFWSSSSGLTIVESLVGTQDRPHSGHRLRKIDGLTTDPLVGVSLLLPSLLPSFLPSDTRYGICFQGDGLRTHRTYLSVSTNLGESWFTFPGTKIFQFFLSAQLNLRLRLMNLIILFIVMNQQRKR